MKAIQLTARLAPRATRALTTSSRQSSVSMKQSFESAQDKGIVPTSEGYQRIQALQNEFHANPEKMVWQKRGLRDSVPTQVTAVLCVGGVALAFYNLYQMSFPKPPE